jgi:type III restriction enzyme
MARGKKQVQASLDFAFFRFLWEFYQQNRGTIRSHYKELSRKYLDFNNPDKNPKAFLRQPQFEALEMYVFLKEYLDNAKVEAIFKDWYESAGRFANRVKGGLHERSGQRRLFEDVSSEQYEAVFAAMRRNSRVYPNYIFALTMGTGKTILMATCIFYEFLLANKFEKDRRFCHNALVFAPDKTVLQSLRELESFDLGRVVPTDYASFVRTNIRFHYLEEAGTTLNTLDKSRFNIIVSNTQKIILKRQHKARNPTDKLFATGKPTYQPGSVYAGAEDLYAFDQPEEEGELTTNQRFEKLCRLGQLGIYVDEAHHAFGKALAKDMGVGAKTEDTSLRTTIDMLAASLERAGTHVVACYNYTGTPYVGREVLPEVVYAYGLREAIDKAFLKRVVLHGYQNIRADKDFVKLAIEHFLGAVADLRPEGTLPKMALFASTIDELTTKLRPAVEKALAAHGIPASRILVNVGDDKHTSNDDIREFNRLDELDSEKQFILLVNKGREGWNCRSLFAVALFREPRSKIFVLQATMRCLRAIGDHQHTGQVYLGENNLAILDEELQQNFRISADDLQKTGNNHKTVEVHVIEPPVRIKLKRVRKWFEMKEKGLKRGTEVGVDPSREEAWEALTEPYRVIHIQREGFDPTDAARGKVTHKDDISDRMEKRAFSEFSLVAEVARYLNRSPLEVEDLLASTKEGTATLVAAVNEFNELLYDKIIPKLFSELYDLTPREETTEHEVELIKRPPPGKSCYTVTADPAKIVYRENVAEAERDKSFHVDPYCFDSNPERDLFWTLLREHKVTKIYFTGMLTHGQSDFYIQYIDPESHTVRSYYPDFIFQREDGTLVIVEVKRDDMIDDPVVQAKREFAQLIAGASGMEYKIIKSSEAVAKNHGVLLV